MCKVNSYISEYSSKSYSNEEGTIIIDCSLGVNPEPIPESVFEIVKKLDNDIIKKYPHEDCLEKAIIKRYEDIASFNSDNICLGNGSGDLLYSHTLLYAGRGETILGHAPQFTAYVDIVTAVGAKYESCPFRHENNIALDFEKFEKYAREVKPRIICCENPNNPTGKVHSIENIEKMVKVAKEIGAAIVIDEAYGEYMPDENSALNLVEKYSNLTVVRTFSKGYGLAGMKVGYVVAQKEVIKEFKKTQLPFGANSVGRRLSAELMNDKDFLKRSIQDTIKSSRKFYEALNEDGMEKFKVASSDECTPIKLVYVENEEIDLAKIFLKSGIGSVSCATFDNLNKNAVRLLLPKDSEIHILINLMKKSAKNI